jgi:hypothetical protein
VIALTTHWSATLRCDEADPVPVSGGVVGWVVLVVVVELVVELVVVVGGTVEEGDPVVAADAPPAASAVTPKAPSAMVSESATTRAVRHEMERGEHACRHVRPRRDPRLPATQKAYRRR